ncbi:hypothetical protein M569_04698, partial [Genlisea aurea]
DPTAAPPPLPAFQPPRSSFSCDRHPAEVFTGFCPSCLCERLTSLDNSSSNTPSSSRRPSSASAAAAAAAIKSLFAANSKGSNHFPAPPKLPRPAAFPPQLRRTKSFSASKNEILGLAPEPQRKSCDVRGRNTLCSLFSQDDKNPGSKHKKKPKAAEEEEEEEDYSVEPEIEETAVYSGDLNDVVCEEIKPLAAEEEEQPHLVPESFLKPLPPLTKLQIDDSNSQAKKNPGGGFWAAASVFSKKWQKWRQKQKLKKHNSGHKFTALPVEKTISHQFRETQSEIADYGFGRRSCDTDPRFSLDAARISIDDPRYSFEEPRASWDGYLLGRTSSRLLAAPMLSVMEDAPPPPPHHRPDMQIPVEEPPADAAGETTIPGGFPQTREYYSDSRRRRSFDRSSSIRKTAAAVIAEIDELKNSSNGGDYLHGAAAKTITFTEDASDFGRGVRRDSSSSSISRNGAAKAPKKSRRWRSWWIWGFIHRRHEEDEYDEDEKCCSSGSRGGNVVGRSYSESWQDFRAGGEHPRNGLSRSVSRSSSSVSFRNGNHHEINTSRGRPENGLLRFYLAPMKGSRRVNGNGGGGGSHSTIARSVLRLY